MRYKNAACVCCGRTFADEDDVVVCPVCGAPHHRACWLETGRCAMNDRHAEGFVWRFPETAEETPSPAPQKDEAEAIGRLHNGEKVLPCPRCGRPNFANDIYCMKCGARMDGSDADEDPDDPDYDYNEEMNNFREIRGDYERYGGISPEAPVDGIPCAEYSDFVGGAHPGRIIRKVSTMERYGKKLSWMWPALLFGPAWYFWRKMKTEGTVFALLLIFFAAVLGLVQLDKTTVKYYKDVASLTAQFTQGGMDMNDFKEKVQEYSESYAAEAAETASPARMMLYNGVQYCLFGGLPLLSCLMAVPLYRKYTKNRIVEIRAHSAGMEEYTANLREEGGTSVAGAVLGALLIVIAFFCAIYLPMIIAVFFI